MFLSQQHHTQYQNLLHVAVANGNVNRVRELLETTDVNARDSQGKTPLHKAAVNGNTIQSKQIFEMLVRNRALNPDLQDNNGDTCLMVACANGCNREYFFLKPKTKYSTRKKGVACFGNII